MDNKNENFGKDLVNATNKLIELDKLENEFEDQEDKSEEED